LEDQNYQGVVTARYWFKGDQVVGQEQLANVAPPRVSEPFTGIDERLKNIRGHELSVLAEKRIVSAVSGMESGHKMK
ncbi:MAG TPA: hypothetical protein VNN13_12355, partial [Methylomirabilota bacterium]|nr:hypothetical protein [Methylomirabilota bacterium]